MPAKWIRWVPSGVAASARGKSVRPADLLALGFDQCAPNLVAQSEELEHERILHLLVSRDGVAGSCLGALGEHLLLIAREDGALVELAVDLAAELSHRPSAAQRLGVVELPCLRRTGAAEEQNVVRPRQRKNAGEIAEGDYWQATSIFTPPPPAVPEFARRFPRCVVPQRSIGRVNAG